MKRVRKHGRDFGNTLLWAIRCVLFIALPATLALLILAEPILTTLFQYGAFGATDVAKAAYSLRAYTLGLAAFMLVKVLAPGFYARQKHEDAGANRHYRYGRQYGLKPAVYLSAHVVVRPRSRRLGLGDQFGRVVKRRPFVSRAEQRAGLGSAADVFRPVGVADGRFNSHGGGTLVAYTRDPLVAQCRDLSAGVVDGRAGRPRRHSLRSGTGNFRGSRSTFS